MLINVFKLFDELQNILIVFQFLPLCLELLQEAPDSEASAGKQVKTAAAVKPAKAASKKGPAKGGKKK